MDSCKFPRLSRSCKATSIYARCFQPWKGPPIFPRLSQLQEFLEHNIKKIKNPLYFKMRWTLSVLFPKRQTHIPRIHARAHAHTHTHKAACSKCQHTIWYLTYKLPWPVVLTLFFFFLLWASANISGVYPPPLFSGWQNVSNFTGPLTLLHQQLLTVAVWWATVVTNDSLLQVNECHLWQWKG